MTLRPLKTASHLALLFALALLVAGCRAAPTPAAGGSPIAVTIVSDGDEQTVVVNEGATVGDVLRRAGVAFDESSDRITPPSYTRVANGDTVTVVRVGEETVAVEEIIPFHSRTVPNEGLAVGETQLLQAGVNGKAEITYRVLYEDGVEVARSVIRRTQLEPPQDEVIMVGSQTDLPTISIYGSLVYISGGNAWVIRGNSGNRRPLTLDGGLDGRVFELSADGRSLLYSRAIEPAQEDAPTGAEPGPFNELWAVLDTSAEEPQAVMLGLQNILYAEWLPGADGAILYSTAEPRAGFPGWQANNDLWAARITLDGTGIEEQRELLEPSGGGIYGWYGTQFAFSPTGDQVAWAQPDAFGVLDPFYAPPEPEPTSEFPWLLPTATPTPTRPLDAFDALPDSYTRRTLAAFAPWNAYDFVWVPTPVWSPDGTLVVTTVHGEPLGREAAEDSPVFNLLAGPPDGSYGITLIEQAGMWAEPVFTPDAAGDAVAYLQAQEPLNSVNGRYQLVVADRDASNARVVFPAEGQPGLLPQPLAWSPDGTQIALVNPGPQGNLLLVDPLTGLTQQVTADGQASSPRWAP